MDDDAMNRAAEAWAPDPTRRASFRAGWRAAMEAQIGNLRTTADNIPVTPANAERIILEMQDRITELEEQTWFPWPPPQNGSWVIALMNDRQGMLKVSWGCDQRNELRWCSATGSYGDGLFCGWVPWPKAPDPAGAP